MTAELEAAGKSLFVNEVPEMILGYWPSEKMTSWKEHQELVHVGPM